MLRSLIWRTLLTNSGITVLGLANSVLLSRWLGPTGRGEVAAAMLWPSLLISLTGAGLISSTLYFAASPESKTEAVFANTMVLGAMQSILLMVVGFVSLPWLLASQTSTVVGAGRLYLLVIPIVLVAQYEMSILQGRMHISVFNCLRAIIPVGYLVAVVAFRIFGGLTLLNIVALHLALNLIVLISALIALLALGVRLGLRADLALARQMLKYGAKVQVGDLSQGMNLRLDQALVAAWLPPSQLGLYVAAVSSASLSQVLSNAVRTVVTPGILRKSSQLERVTLLQEAFRKFWLIASVATLVFALLLPMAIPLVFGLGFQEAVWPAEALLLGALVVGAKDILTGGAQALGDPWLGSRAELVAMAVTVVTLPILLSMMGIMGAATASVAVHATVLVMVVWGLQRSFAISPKRLFHVRSSDLRTIGASFGLKVRG